HTRFSRDWSSDVCSSDLGAEAVAAAREDEVDLAILDIAMPRMTGIQAAREISRRAPGIRILMLSMYDNEQYFFESLKAGASGYEIGRASCRESGGSWVVA